jgi:hypothetical protein
MRFLCHLGLHSWKLSKGVGYARDTGPMAIFYTKDCRRCGKHEDAAMVV